MVQPALSVDATAQALGFRDANDLLRMFYGHDGYARRRPRGYRRMARQRPADERVDGQGNGDGVASPRPAELPRAVAG